MNQDLKQNYSSYAKINHFNSYLADPKASDTSFEPFPQQNNQYKVL